MKRFIFILLVVLQATVVPAAKGAESLCDKALSSCEASIETLKKLRANEQEMNEILQQQRDKAVKNQGPSLGDKIEYGLVGGAAALVIYFLIHSNK